jgi:hypothetical protein
MEFVLVGSEYWLFWMKLDLSQINPRELPYAALESVPSQPVLSYLRGGIKLFSSFPQEHAVGSVVADSSIINHEVRLPNIDAKYRDVVGRTWCA